MIHLKKLVMGFLCVLLIAGVLAGMVGIFYGLFIWGAHSPWSLAATVFLLICYAFGHDYYN